MTREKLDTLWFQAMRQSIEGGEDFVRYHFAALVAAAEREACAAICDEMMRQLGEIGETVEAGGAGYCAEEIRRRGET